MLIENREGIEVPSLAWTMLLGSMEDVLRKGRMVYGEWPGKDDGKERRYVRISDGTGTTC